MEQERNNYRDLTELEKGLLYFLTVKIDKDESLDFDSMKVMNLEGGMGSIRIIPKECLVKEKRMIGEKVNECQFKDSDGVDVLVTLYRDLEGYLFELDVWKMDYTNLISVPDEILRKFDDFQ